MTFASLTGAGIAPPSLVPLFTSYSASGFLFDRLDPADGLQWQDSGQTTPATATGDPIGYVQSRDPDTNDASQATSGSRPTLTGGPPWYWAFDGSADHFDTGLIPGAAMTLAMCFAPSTNRYPLGVTDAGTFDSGNCFLGKVGGTGVLAGAWGTVGTATIQGTTGITSGVPCVGLLRANGSNVKLHLNGTEEYSGSPSGSPSSTRSMFLGGTNVAGTAGLLANNPVYRAFAIQAYVNDTDALLIQKSLGYGVVAL